MFKMKIVKAKCNMDYPDKENTLLNIINLVKAEPTDDFYINFGDDSIRGYYKSNHFYCKACSKFYKHMCNKYYNKINSIINNDNIYDYIYNIKNRIKNKSKLKDETIIEFKKNLKDIKKYILKCVNLREKHHSNCIKYIGTDDNKKQTLGDTGHHEYIIKLKKIINEISILYKDLQNIKQLKSDRSRDLIQDEEVFYDDYKGNVKITNVNRNHIFKNRSFIKLKNDKRNKSNNRKIRRSKLPAKRSFKRTNKKYREKKSKRSRRKSYKISRK